MAGGAWGKGPPGSLPRTLEGQSDLGEALAPSLRGTGPHLSMASGLDGVMDVVVVTDLVACGETSRRKVASLLLPRLSAPGSQSVRAVAKGVVVASHHLQGMGIEAPSVGSGRCLGWLGERGVVLRG
jgi:hypothetical protein